MKLLINSFITVVVLFSFVTAQQQDYSKETGYLDFGNLEELESGNRVVDVFLEGNLLRLVGKLTEKEDPELAELITGLKLIKAKVLEVTSQNENKLTERFKTIEGQLKKKNWSMLVRVRDEGEFVNVYLKSSGVDKIDGLVVTSIDGDGAAFVNIVGNINLEAISKLSNKFDIPALDKVHGKKEKQ